MLTPMKFLKGAIATGLKIGRLNGRIFISVSVVSVHNHCGDVDP